MSTLRVCVYVRGLRRRRESRNKEFSSKVSTKGLASISVLCKASSRDPYIKLQLKLKFPEDKSNRKTNPTDPSTTLELQNPSHSVPNYINPDLEVLELGKGRSG